MADKRTKAGNTKLLHDTLIYTLTDKERRQFILILSEFQTRRNRENFVISLRRLLDTPKKQEVVPYLIAILPNREREHFLNLWMRTSTFNSLYSLSENRNVKFNSRLSGQTSYSNGYHNSFPLHQRQKGRFEKKKPLLRLSQSYGKARRNFSTSRPPSRLVKNRLSASLPSLRRSISQLDKQVKTHQVSLKRDSKSHGFGFSIRGGAEHGLGIFVSSVDVGSVADRKHLSVGDQIIKLNEHNFQNITSAEATKIIQHKKKLRMLIYSSAMVPGSRVAHVEYQWVDTNGRPSSPPLNFRKSDLGMGRSRSIGDIRLLQDDDERRVVVHVSNNTRLGLRIRGGTEFGIGIFVSSVDQNRVAERAGIRAGDQIVDVNGIDFQEIAHKDAVRVLKGYRMMSILLRHIGKIPYARTIFEKTEWLESARTSRSSSVISIAQDARPNTSPEKSIFRQGIAGSQLLHQSTVVVPAHKRIEEQARLVLSDKELVALKYYISQYIQGEIHVEGLVISLFHLFDSSTKISLLNDIRTVIFPQELDSFDRMVLEKEVEARKSLNGSSSRNGLSAGGNHLQATSNSPKVPAKALSYKQLKSPKQQVVSRNPWSPPTTPLPSIPVHEQVLFTEDVQVHKESPVIDDLDFEEEEDEPNNDESSRELKRNLEEDFDMEISQENETPTMHSFGDNGNLYEEIELSMRIAMDDSAQMADQPGLHDQQYFSSSTRIAESSSLHAVDTIGSFDRQSVDRANHIPSNENKVDSDDARMPFMKNTLLDSAADGYRKNRIEKDVEKDSAVGPNELTRESSENHSDAVVDDILALYAKPDKSGIHKLRGDKSNDDIFLPKLLPNETEIPETDVSLLAEQEAERNKIEPTFAEKFIGEDDVIIEKEAETLLLASPLSWYDYPKDSESCEQIRSEKRSTPTDDEEVVDLSSYVQSIQIGEDDQEPDRNENSDGGMTLEELQNIGADLEFEFDDEQEVAELEEVETDTPLLKFAPIEVQETAPSSPVPSSNMLNKDSIDATIEGDRPHNDDEGNAVNTYKPSIPRSFGFPGLSGTNRRQMFKVQDISTADSGGFDGFHSFSPKILSSIDMNKGSLHTRDSVESDIRGSNDAKIRNLNAEKNETDQNFVVGKDLSQTSPRNSSDYHTITFPDRRLSNKRIPVISYKADSPEKKSHDDYEFSEINSQEESSTRNDEANSDVFTFHKLRSIFEYEPPGTPRTEYLSEIIRKNNTEVRRRFQSSESVDENSNEIGMNSSTGMMRETTGERKEYDSLVGSSTNGTKNNSSYFKIKRDDRHSVAESDLSSFEDFDFSSSISKRTLFPSLTSQAFDDKLEISSGYDSEDYSPINENGQKTVWIEKNRKELGIVLEPSKKIQKGVQVKEILNGEFYAACQCPQLQVGQEVLSVGGESLQGLGAKIATICMNRAYNNPSGRLLEIVVRNLQFASKR